MSNTIYWYKINLIGPSKDNDVYCIYLYIVYGNYFNL